MLNLLIREDRHWLRKEYLLRFALVFVLFFILSLIAWGAVIASMYVQIRVERDIVREELQRVRETSESKNINALLDLDKELRSITNQLKVLNFNQTELILEIVSKRQQGVSISLISSNLKFGEEGEVYANFELRGIAETRSALVDYQNVLSESKMFEKVNIPFSSFAQNAEIPFTASIETVELNNYFEEVEASKEIEESGEQIEAATAVSATTSTSTDESLIEDENEN